MPAPKGIIVRISLLLIGLLGAIFSSQAGAKPHFSATIVRTTFGIPHITAHSWGGIGYGVGYAYAQDNLCMLAEEFVTVSGDRSHYFGPGNRATIGTGDVDNLASDIFFRAAIDLPALRRGLRRQGSEIVQLVAGYAAGYNRWLRDAGPDGLPVECRGKPWVRPISTDDLLRLTEKQVISSSVAFAASIAQAAPPGSDLKTAQTLGFASTDGIEVGSNGWAFGGDVTASGHGLLVGNPHFPWNGTNRFWQMHVTLPGKLDVMGASLAGSPLPTIGFNRDVAWTHTVTAAQHFTLFQLTLDPADPTAYLIDGKSEKMGVAIISVPQADGPAIKRTLYTSRFGPVLAMPAAGLSWTRTQAFAVRDANRGNQRSLATWLAIGRARDVGEILHAVESKLGIPWVNTIAADRHGNVLHADITAVPNVSGQMIKDCATPLSALAAKRAILLDGSRSACAWPDAGGTPVAGLMPGSLQAKYLRRDFVANSNDSYWLSNPKAPYAALSPILGAAGTERSLRTRSGLIEIDRQLNPPGGAAGAKIDRPRAEAMVLANHSLAAELVVDPLLLLCRGKAELAAACAALRGWDRKYDLDSRGAYLFSTFWLAARTAPDLWEVAFDPADPVHTPRGLRTAGPAGERLLAALRDAASRLEATKTPLDGRWGDVQYAPRGAERIPIHGGEGLLGVLNVQLSTRVADGLVPRSGSSYIQVVDFDAAGPVADAVLSYSQSSDPASPYFADQTRLYSAKKWHRLPFSADQIRTDRIGASIELNE